VNLPCNPFAQQLEGKLRERFILGHTPKVLGKPPQNEVSIGIGEPNMDFYARG
jgi:hypothetical protein